MLTTWLENLIQSLRNSTKIWTNSHPLLEWLFMDGEGWVLMHFHYKEQFPLLALPIWWLSGHMSKSVLYKQLYNNLAYPSLFILLVPASLEDENRELKHKMVCKACMEKNVEVTFLPCGHFVVCESCSKKIKKCPICRKCIRGYLKTYLS